MPDYITIEHARAVVSHTSRLTENKYSEIVAAANETEKAKLIKTAIGPRMDDFQPSGVTVVDNDSNNKITKEELAATFNKELIKNGGAELTQKQIDYLWSTSINVIKDPGGSDTATNSPASVSNPSSSTVTNPAKPVEDTEAPTLSSSNPSNGATDIARNSNIDITFSGNIGLADATKIKLRKKSDDTEVGITTSIEGDKTLRIKPQADLGASTEYYVTIDPAAITDTSKNNNAYAGITANTDFSFTTGTTVLTSEQQAAANQAAAKKNKPVPTQLSSNSFNKPVTKLNLDAETEQSDDEERLAKLVNLRYGLDLLESKDNVHVALGGNEENYVDGALESLRNSTAPDSQIDNGRYDEYKDGEIPTSPGAFILKQAIEEYKKIDKTLAGKAEKARDKKINAMAEDEKTALITVFENYQKKFTKLKEGISEDKLKKYLTDNYDTLKDLGIDDFPADTAGINGKKKEELITLSVAARNNLNEKISEEFKNITISPDDKKAFLKKYTDIDFSDSGKSIELIKGLTDKELLLLNKYINSDNAFNSRDFIIRELSQHKLSLENTLGLIPYRLSDDADLISFTDRENLLKKYDPKNTDLNKKKEFIQGLTPAELVLLDSSLGFVSKESLLRELDKPENKEKSLGDILNAGVVLSYVEGLQSKHLEEINRIVNNPEIKAALMRNIVPLAIEDKFKYSKDGADGQLYKSGDSYLVDFGEGKAKFYKNQNELLGLPNALDDGDNQFIKLAKEKWGINDPNSILRLSQNAGRLKTPGVTDGSNQTNTLHTILEKIYASEKEALKTKEETTKWHQEMKRRVAKLLMSSSDDEFVKNRQEFQKYLNDTYSGINGWNIFHIDGWRKEFNSADAQTEGMLKEVRDLLRV
jgi:hypothetical protein